MSQVVSPISSASSGQPPVSLPPIVGVEVRPLRRTRKADNTPYTREKDVEAQIGELCQMSPRLRARRLEDAGSGAMAWTDARRLREETLVYFLRESVRGNDEALAGKIAEILVDRVSAHVARKIGAWRLGPGEADDCVRDLFAQMFAQLYDLEPSAEFWEVRFWLCLDRRLYNLLELKQAVRDNEIRAGDQTIGDGADDESGTIDRLIGQLTDTGASPEATAERRELLELLTENERGALYYVFVAGLPEESDDPAKQSAAKMLGVTGRSVRNYLTRAKEKISKYQSGQAGAGSTKAARKPVTA